MEKTRRATSGQHDGTSNLEGEGGGGVELDADTPMAAAAHSFYADYAEICVYVYARRQAAGGASIS